RISGRRGVPGASPRGAALRSRASPAERAHVEDASLDLAFVVVERPGRRPAEHPAVGAKHAVVTGAEESLVGGLPVEWAAKVCAVVVEDLVRALRIADDPDLHLAGDVHPALMRGMHVVGQRGFLREPVGRPDDGPLGLLRLSKPWREKAQWTVIGPEIGRAHVSNP